MPVWKLASADNTVSLNVNAIDDEGPHDGEMNGTITYKGTLYGVSGGWAASGFARHASAFGLSGAAQGHFIAATGIMTGPGTAPARIDIQVDVASTSGTIDDYKGVLFPSS